MNVKRACHGHFQPLLCKFLVNENVYDFWKLLHKSHHPHNSYFRAYIHCKHTREHTGIMDYVKFHSYRFIHFRRLLSLFISSRENESFYPFCILQFFRFLWPPRDTNCMQRDFKTLSVQWITEVAKVHTFCSQVEIQA